MKYLLLLFFIVGCTKVDKYGITTTVESEIFSTQYEAYADFKERVHILCIQNDYKSFKTLNALYVSNGYGIRVKGVGQCLK